MRIVIIDDEVGTRESIKVLGGFRDNPEVEIFESQNGFEGYKMIEDVKPDLIFLDMNMPIMDGADLLNMLDENECNAKVIVVSGYTDFRYTKAAIVKKYVVDYIQKPIDEKQIKTAIQKVAGNWNMGTAKERAPIVEKGQVFGIFIEDFAEILKKNFNNSLDLLKFFLIQQVEHQISQVELFDTGNSNYKFAFCFRCGTFLPELQVLLERILLSLEKRHGIKGYAVYEEEIEKADVKKRCTEICEYINYVNLNGKTKVYKRKNLKKPPAVHTEVKAWVTDVVSCIQHHNESGFAKNLNEMFGELLQKESFTIYELKIFMSAFLYDVGKRLNIKEVYSQEIISKKMEELYAAGNMVTIDFGKRWIGDYYEKICVMLETENNRIPEKMRQMVFYLEENYKSKITQMDMAERFYFNASTISRMFVKYMGVNFSEYLNTIRLEKAKDLLKTTERTVSDVAQEVGFESLSYFSKQFKRKYGMNPQEYKKDF
ncbi:MAG: helix-turn-helix domain-containing protein [Clostridiales bacterium]|nr:helix-turn-helix domain-containing protein [Clostridiales bacterium]